MNTRQPKNSSSLAVQKCFNILWMRVKLSFQRQMVQHFPCVLVTYVKMPQRLGIVDQLEVRIKLLNILISTKDKTNLKTQLHVTKAVLKLVNTVLWCAIFHYVIIQIKSGACRHRHILITLTSCVSKLFSILFTVRLKSFFESEKNQK